MRMRQLLLSSVMCGGVVLMSSTSWSQTGPKVTYNPQGDWAVTRMAANAPGKVPYCTMARRFGNNVILTFARNASDETSVAMDFPSKTLAKGKSYYVTLDAGANEKRAFDVQPVSDKAMVIRLGHDAKFHGALSQSGALNVDVAGQQYEFRMPDMAKGDQDLSGCVGSIVEPAAGAGAKPVQTAQVDALKADAPAPMTRRASDDILAAPITNLNENAPAPVLQKDQGSAAAGAMPVAAPAMASEMAHLESLREENMRLKNALERERREYEERFMRESAGSSQVSEVMEKVKLLEKENSDLKYQLADARSMVKAGTVSRAVPEPTQCAAADPKAGAEISVLREENTRLKADIAAQKTAMVQLEMQAKASEDKANVANANEAKAHEAKAEEAKVASVDNAVVARMQSRIDELVSQNSKLQADLLSAKAAAAAPVTADGSISLSQLRSIETQLHSVEQERDALRAQIDKMGENQENDLLKLSGSDWNLEQATRRYNEAEREIRRLGSQLEQSRSRCAAEKKEIEYMLFDPAIATQQQISKLMTLESEVNVTKEALAQKDQEVSGRIKEYEDKIAALEAEKNISKASDSELAALRAELDIAKQSAAEQLAVAQQRAEEAQRLAEAKRVAEEKVASLQGRVQQDNAAGSDSLSAQLAQVNAEKEQMAQRIAALEADQQKMQNSHGDRVALQQRVSTLESQELQLEGRIAAGVQPAAGTPRQPVQEMPVQDMPVQEMHVAAVNAVSPDVVSAAMPASMDAIQREAVGSPTALRPGQVSPRIEAPSPIALAPKSAIASDAFQPTQAVVQAVQQTSIPHMGAQQITPQQPMIAAAAASSNLMTADALSGQLRAAGLPVNGAVKRIDNVSNAQAVAYSWDANGLFGSAEQKQMANAEQFMTLVQQYLDKTKSRCAGDFAASPVPTLTPPAGMQVASYEIACINADGAGATAALAFYGKQGVFTTVAHESNMDTMDMAMDARDRLLANVIK